MLDVEPSARVVFTKGGNKNRTSGVREGVDAGGGGTGFDASLWLKQNYGLELPEDPSDLLRAAWEPLIEAEIEDTSSAWGQLLGRPRGTPMQVLGQALDLHRIASRLDRLANPHRGPKDDRVFDVLQAFTDARDALKRIPPELVSPLGIGRVVTALESAVAHLQDHRRGLHKLGLAPAGGVAGRPADIPTRACNQWLRLAGLDKKGRAAALIYLGVSPRPAGIAQKALSAEAERVRRLHDLARPEGGQCLHPILGLVTVAWCWTEAVRGSPRGELAFSSAGPAMLLGDAEPGPPPPITRSPGSRWAWVPFPFWSVADEAEFEDLTTWAAQGPFDERGAAEFEATKALLDRLFSPPEETAPTSGG